LLVSSFVFAAPAIIAYSLGYRLDIFERDLKKTGGIFVKSATPRLSIFLDGEFKKETSLISGGALLTDLAPGTHLLRIEKAGFNSWSKTAIVKPEIVTELRDIVLVPGLLESTTTVKSKIPLPVSASKPKIPYSLTKKGDLVGKLATTTKILAQNVQAFELAGSNILYIDKNGFLARISISAGNIETIGRPGFFLGGKEFQFIKTPEEEFAILDPSGGLFLLDSTSTISVIGGGIKKIYFDEDGEKALLLKEREIEVLWLSDNTYQPFQKRGQKEKIISLDEKIVDARWYYGDNSHIVLATTEGIFFTDIDGRGGKYTAELTETRADEIFTSPEVPETIFYLLGEKWFRIAF